MTPKDLLDALEAAGFRLTLDETAEGLKPQLNGKPQSLTDELRAALAEHRDTLVQMLLHEKRLASSEAEGDPQQRLDNGPLVRFMEPLGRRIW